MNGPVSGLCVVLMTAPDDQKAEALARALVEEQLAACVNLVPKVRSIYRWEGALEDATETLLLAKTTSERFDALKARVLSLHPYQLPEVICLDVADGHGPYLDWVRTGVSVNR